MALMHLWEAGSLLNDREFADGVRFLGPISLETERVQLQREISSHPLLRLRTALSAHYRPHEIAESLKHLEGLREPWTIEATNRPRKDWVFTGPTRAVVARLTAQIQKGPDASSDALVLKQLAQAVRRMVELRSPLDDLLWRILARMVERLRQRNEPSWRS